MVLAACETPRPSVTHEPDATDAAVASGPAATPTVAPATAPPPPSEPPTIGPPTAQDLILTAFEAGKIDEATSYLYRFYAQWGDPRLPEEYRAGRVEDLDVQVAASAHLDTLSDEDQTRLRPFLVRPTDPLSYWTADPTVQPSESEDAGGVALANARLSALTDDFRCRGGLWSRTDIAALPVTIWGRCRVRADGSTEFTLQSSVDRTVAAVTSLWRPMTSLMGEPLPDGFRGTSRAEDEVQEAGDGRLDIYIVEAPNVAYGRFIDNSAIATTYSAPREVNGGQSAYMVLDPTKAPSDLEFKSTVAHELFHTLEYRHVVLGMFGCLYPSLSQACGGPNWKAYWFAEASAVWAEHEFVPEARAVQVYPRVERFLGTWRPLTDTRNINQYDSFVWPLFMEQENGSASIADAWRAMEGKHGWDEIQQAVDAQLPFKEHFRDFAVRVWNEQLLPGDPIHPRFNAPSLDPTFPTTQPDEAPPGYRFKEAVAITLGQQSYSIHLDLLELQTAFYDVSFASDVRSVTLNFSGLRPAEIVDVDALVKLGSGSWERRQLDSVTEWCFERQEDAVQQMILVVSNHAQQPQTWLQGDWTVQPKDTGCLQFGDSLVYHSTRVVGAEGESYYQKVTESFVLFAKLKSAPEDSPYFAQFLNDGSTFTASVDTYLEVEGLPNCPTISEGSGGSGGAVPGDDGVVGNLWEDVRDPPFGSTAPPTRTWMLTIAGGVAVPTTTSVGNCSGSWSETGEHGISLPPCDGVEIQDDDPTSRVFEFRCQGSEQGWEWSVTGRMTVPG